MNKRTYHAFWTQVSILIFFPIVALWNFWKWNVIQQICNVMIRFKELLWQCCIRKLWTGHVNKSREIHVYLTHDRSWRFQWHYWFTIVKRILQINKVYIVTLQNHKNDIQGIVYRYLLPFLHNSNALRETAWKSIVSEWNNTPVTANR